jgi:hypothetical protein
VYEFWKLIHFLVLIFHIVLQEEVDLLVGCKFFLNFLTKSSFNCLGMTLLVQCLQYLPAAGSGTQRKKKIGMCITMGVTAYIECGDKDTWLLRNTFKMKNSFCRAPLFLGCYF